MGEVSCYSMDLYCDSPEHPVHANVPDVYTGRSFSDCIRQARKDGWLFRKDVASRTNGCGFAICPKHRKPAHRD